MSHLYDTIEPTVIDDVLLAQVVEEQGPKEEAGKLAKLDGIDFKTVGSLQIDYKNILKIDGLSQFTNLTKLQLDNNIIERIENLAELVNLVWLDLSFNNIEVIEGLETLTKIEDLTLFSNRIRRIENLDSLKNLEILSIGSNNLRELENLAYLRRFPKLKTLNLAKNPFCQLDIYKAFAAAALPKLVYLDYRLVSDEWRAEGYDKFQILIEEWMDDEKKRSTAEEEAENQAEELAFHSTAFVERLNTNYLFDSMYKDDKEGRAIRELPRAHAIVGWYRDHFTNTCKQMFKFGLHALEKRKMEVDLFWECVEEALKENKRQATAALSTFLEMKMRRFNRLQSMSDPRHIHKAVTDFNHKLTQLWDKLMGNEMHLVEQLEEITQTFDISLQDHVAYFVEGVQSFTAKLREEEATNNERIVGLCNDSLDSILRGELEDMSSRLKEVFQDKDSVATAVANSHDNHMLVIDRQEDHMVQGINTWAEQLMQRIDKELLYERNRHRVIEINHIIDKVREEMEGMEICQ